MQMVGVTPDILKFLLNSVEFDQFVYYWLERRNLSIRFPIILQFFRVLLKQLMPTGWHDCFTPVSWQRMQRLVRFRANQAVTDVSAARRWNGPALCRMSTSPT